MYLTKKNNEDYGINATLFQNVHKIIFRERERHDKKKLMFRSVLLMY